MEPKFRGRARRLAVLALANALFWPLAAPRAGADDVKGLNIGLLNFSTGPLKSNLAPIDAASLAQLEQDNRRRIGVAHAGGFNLVRLRFRIVRLRENVPQDQRGLTLQAVTDFVKAANAEGIKVFVALVAENGHDAQDLVCKQPGDLAQAAVALARALPDSPMAGIEPFNEPPDGCGPANGGARWINLQQALYRQIRAVRPHVVVVASGGGWGTLDGLLKLDPSPYRADANVFFSFHYYEPFLFTGQGQPGLYPASRINVPHFPWPYDASAVQQAKTAAMQQLGGDRTVDDNERANLRTGLGAEYDRYAQTGAPGFAQSRFEEAKRWAAGYGIGGDRIFVGEFGVIRQTRNAEGVVEPSAARWIASVVRAARRDSFLWAVFDLDTAYAIVCGAPPSDTICDGYRAALQ